MNNMTLEDIIYTYDVTIEPSFEDSKLVWGWYVNCGYQSFWKDGFNSPAEAGDALIAFLKDWEGPTK